MTLDYGPGIKLALEVKKMTTLNIGQLAKKSQVNIGAIRYYKRRGITPEPPRRESSCGQYPENAVVRIQFVKRAQESDTVRLGDKKLIEWGDQNE